MSGYTPTEEDIATMVRELEQSDPANANPEYARQFLIRTKLMYRELGRIDDELLHREMEAFRTESTESDSH